MKLKHLTLRGFKSFADRTRLDFASGVNVVVGPNGSGKSNILDAIAWVMGTQATKSLRTEKMEDVVFAGTATRPALSRAEVQITFANDDETMAIGVAEITITRRLFRDGTSEYELNGAPCRLLDIQELLSDGGIGRQQHVLVGQGHIGDVLNARPEDHRAVIEEAAGVTKHRSRRDRAVRRLERTDHDVERLNDILREQKKALRPLKRQAKAAERHDSVRDEARVLRLYLGGEEIRRIRSRLGSAAIEREAAIDARNESDAELGVIRGRLEVLRSEAGEVGSLLARDTEAAARLETVAERLRGIATVSRERRRSLEARLEGADERRDDLQRERADLAAEIEATHRAEVEAGDDADRKETAFRAFEDEERSLAEQIQLPAEGVVANLRGDLRALETAAERDIAERAQIAARVVVVRERGAEELEEVERLNLSIQATDGRTGPLQDAYAAASAARASAQVDWEGGVAANNEQRLVVAGCAARVEALEAALDGLVDETARSLAAAADGVSGSLAAALDVPSDVATAVDAALGPWRDAFVASDHRRMVDAASGVRAAGSGGVSFVTAGRSRSAGVADAVAEFGVERLVDRLGPKADLAIADAYLGNVVIVEGWMTAHTVVQAHPSIMAVTPEGDVVTADAMLVAQADGAGPAALEAARVDLEVAERELQRTNSRLTTTQRAFEAARTGERTALEALEAVEAELAGSTEALALVQRAHAASVAEVERLESRMAAIDEASAARSVRVASLRQRVSEFEGEEAVRQAAWDALNERRSAIAAQRDEARRVLERAAAERASIIERRRLSERRLATVDAELAQLVLVPDTDLHIADLAGIETAADRTVAIVTSKIQVLRERQREHRALVGEASAELAAAEDRREMLEAARRMAADRLGVLEVELAELRVRLEAAIEGLRRDVDSSEEQAMATQRPDIDEDVDLEARLATLLADLRRMGPVNPLAAAEFAALSDEVDELERQLGDLEESRAELKKVIAALDDRMVALFQEAFEEITAFYHENFSLVFPGGVGNLRLTDPDDAMGTGVVVEAQPAGKKVGRLSLLSGGERSLAALAFLFAVFRARPSPFYVLDEVEAALDDANLHRFLRLVETLRRNTQLVIITHQQQTMESADVLYGVTMEPGESSKVLSKRMHPVTV